MMTKSTPILAAAAATVLAGALAAPASAEIFFQTAQVDLTATSAAGNASEIGSNPIAVAWDGTNAYLAGTNNGTTARDVAVVRVSGVTGTPVFGPRFGVKANTPGSRGYLGIDVTADGAGIGASYDSGAITATATVPASSITAFNADGTQRFNFVPTDRPPAGPAFDPISGRLTYQFQGSNLLRNLNALTGAETGNVDAQIGPVVANVTTNRGSDYDEATGNFWVRNNNDVVRAQRAADGTFTSAAKLVDLTNSNSVGTDVAYLNGADTDFAIYNNRANNAAAQAFASVVMGVNDDGSNEALTFLGPDGTTPVVFADGNSVYGFDWDAGTNTLALLDSANRQLFIFAVTPPAVVPEPTSMAVLGLAGAGLLARRRRA